MNELFHVFKCSRRSENAVGFTISSSLQEEQSSGCCSSFILGNVATDSSDARNSVTRFLKANVLTWNNPRVVRDQKGQQIDTRRRVQMVFGPSQRFRMKNQHSERSRRAVAGHSWTHKEGYGFHCWPSLHKKLCHCELSI